MRGERAGAQPGAMSDDHTTLRIEHPVPDYDRWKQAFDSDPVGRERMGVRGYRVLRAVDDPNYVMIDLEFENRREADGLLAAMREIWSRTGQVLTANQQARLAETVESKEY